MKDVNQEIQDNILLLGNRDDVYRLYQAMDVFVLPSRVEGFGLAAVEAQINGTWIIVSSAVKDEAILVNAYDRLKFFNVSEWVDKIISSKEKNCELSDKTDKFNIENQAVILENYYYKLLCQF